MAFLAGAAAAEIIEAIVAAVEAGEAVAGAAEAGEAVAGAAEAGEVAAEAGEAVEAGEVAAEAVEAGEVAAEAGEAGEVAAEAGEAELLNIVDDVAIDADVVAQPDIIAGQPQFMAGGPLIQGFRMGEFGQALENAQIPAEDQGIFQEIMGIQAEQFIDDLFVDFEDEFGILEEEAEFNFAADYIDIDMDFVEQMQAEMQADLVRRQPPPAA